jgi:hypothetical protein
MLTSAVNGKSESVSPGVGRLVRLCQIVNSVWKKTKSGDALKVSTRFQLAERHGSLTIDIADMCVSLSAAP